MKSLIHRILVATDFSPSSERSFHMALKWAASCDAVLEIVHVFNRLPEVEIDSAVANLYIQEHEKYSQAKLEAFVSQAKKTLSEVHAHFLDGLPSEQIIKLAQTTQADLVITGTHGWTGIDRVMMGSVAERVICQAPCPVLSIRDVQSGSTDLNEDLKTEVLSTLRRILLPIDFSDCSLDAYEYVANLEKPQDISITLLHVIEPLSYSLDFTISHPTEDRKYREKIKARLTELTHTFTKQGFTANYLIESKLTSEAIMAAAAKVRASLIVMGTHGRQGLRRLVMGNVATAVLRQSLIPVLTVKSPKYRRATDVGQPETLHNA